ncbi:MAG TPA: hypothetical protein VGJ21_25095 [Terracidiphilus sp.]|jgi:hypothetical protein
MRKWLVTILAVPAAFLPLAAMAQVAPDRPISNTPELPRYSAYVGFSYTSLNQVNQSRYGLIGANAEVSRNFGRFFAVVIDGGFYPQSLAAGNPGNPSVSMGLAGPEVHGQIFEKWGVFVHGLLGFEHTGGEEMNPSTSFAGGAGGGIEHTLSPHWALRASGDDIGASFSLRNNTTQQGNSPHRTFNSRAGIGVVYRF